MSPPAFGCPAFSQALHTPWTPIPLHATPAKDGRARLSLLLRANYPSISLGKDSGHACKTSIH